MNVKCEGGGVTSCLSVRLDQTIKYWKLHGHLPASINSSSQFQMYRDEAHQDVSELIMGKYRPVHDLPFLDYNHGWQYGFYDEVQIEKLSMIAAVVCPLSDEILDKSHELHNWVKGRTAVLFRGNDKAVEIDATPYNEMIKMAKASGSTSFVVQTDEQDFFDYFKSVYPDTVAFELPRINRNFSSYAMVDTNKPKFAADFLAALIALAKCDQLLLNTGNTGLWTCIFRKNINGVMQYHGQHKQWRKLGE